MRHVFAAFYLLMVHATLLQAADLPGYRVAGIVGQNNKWLYAIIEAPDGSSRIFSRGEAISGEGVIVSVTDQGIVVEKDGETRVLSLQGGKYTNAASDVPPGETLDLLKEMPRKELLGRIVASGCSQKNAECPQLTGGAVNEILGIPALAKITAINGKSVSAPRDALTLTFAELDQHSPLVRVFFSGIEGVSQMYITLRDDPVPLP